MGVGVLTEDVEELSRKVLDAAFKVHRNLGPGLLESVYERCLCYELRRNGVEIQTQLSVPIIYDGVHIDAGLRIDILVADVIIVELKAVEKIHLLCVAQVLTYLKLAGLRLGLVINFNVPLLRDGIRRIIR